MNKKTIITGFLTLILMGGNVLLATHGNDYSRKLEGYESESDVEETKGEQAEDETEEQYWQRMRQEAEEMRHGLEGDDTQASPFGSGLEDTNEEDLIYVVPSPDPSYVAHEPLIAPKGAFDMPRNNLAYIGLGSEMPVFQDHQVETHQLNQKHLNYQLIKAVLKGDLDSVKCLLERGADVDAAGPNGNTILISAAEKGYSNIVQFLLDNRADIDAANKFDMTALITATSRGYSDIVKLLLKRGANTEAFNQLGRTALTYAAEAGNLDIVKCLLEREADINATNNTSTTLLALVASRGHRNIVEFLLDNEANIEATDKKGNTPLALAVIYDRFQVAELLLKREANIEATDTEGNTPLASALRFGHFRIAELLLNKGAKKPSIPELLHLFTIRNNALFFAGNVIKSLRFGRDSSLIIKLIMTKVFDCEWNLESLLDIAIKNNITYSNFFKLCKIYHLLGQEETTVNELSQSITYKLFESAVLENNIEALMALFLIMISCKIDINFNATNEDGEGLLHIALRHGELEIIQTLLKSGYAFDLELVNAEGETPLSIAFKNGYNEIAAYLAHQNETQNISLEVNDDTRLPAESLLQGDHPNPNAGEDEPPAKRQRIESGEEDEEDLNESVEDADAQDGQESIFALSRTRKTKGLGKFDS